MASGKQLSFQHGEVSPSQRFKSDAVSYATGVYKLKNKFVRRSGGISNRPGLIYLDRTPFQEEIPSEGGSSATRGFTFWSAEKGDWQGINYAPKASTGVGYALYINGNEIPMPTADPVNEAWFTTPPEKIRFTMVKDKIFVTPELTYVYPDAGGFYPPGTTAQFNVVVQYDTTTSEYVFKTLPIPSVGIFTWVGAISGHCVGLAPFLPVSYLITANYFDGREVAVNHIETAGYTSAWNPSTLPAGKVVMPHSQLSVTMQMALSAAQPDIKFFNFYRGAGAGGPGKTFYKLAGRVLYDQAALTIDFADYGGEVAAVTPPLDEKMYADLSFRGANFAAYYQQRLIMGMEPGITDDLKSGDHVASKLGSPLQIAAPIIYSDNGGFTYNIPVTDASKPVAALAMERLINFTGKGTYVIRGGEQGVLTPTTVNPLLISSEGCSPVVEPKIVGRRGYYLNHDHTKLMCIVFGNDGNLDVFEASILSEHFLYEDIHQMEALSGERDTIFLVRRDGKMVMATASDEGIHGFSLYEVDGHIESVFASKAPKPYVHNVSSDTFTEKVYDVLCAFVIRNGKRFTTYLPVREDRHMPGEFFADMCWPFGTRIAQGAGGLYKKTNANPLTGPSLNVNSLINIGDGTITDYTSGQDIPIYFSQDFYMLGSTDVPVIHFYYDDANGIEQTLRFTPDNTTLDFDFHGKAYEHYKVTGVFDSDVPADLQNVESNLTLAFEIVQGIKSRWCPAYNQYHIDDATYDDVYEDDEPMAVFADGEVLASPLNPNKSTVITLDKGTMTFTLPDYYAWGYIGVPYESEFVSLDIEASDNRTLTGEHKLVTEAGIALHQTRGGFYGLPDVALTEMEEPDFSTNPDFNPATPYYGGYYAVSFPGEYNGHGRVCVKQVDPCPMTILSIYPKGIAGG